MVGIRIRSRGVINIGKPRLERGSFVFVLVFVKRPRFNRGSENGGKPRSNRGMFWFQFSHSATGGGLVIFVPVLTGPYIRRRILRR